MVIASHNTCKDKRRNFLGIPGHRSWEKFITSEAAKRFNFKAERNEVREILTVNSSKRLSVPILNLLIESLDKKESEKIKVTGTKLRYFTTVRRLDINKLKEQYEHTKDKRFYTQIGDEYPIHVIS